MLCAAIDECFSVKGMVALHGSIEDVISDLPRSVTRKPQILDVDVS